MHIRNSVPRLEQARVSGSRNYDTKWLGYLCRKGDFLFRGIVIDRADRRAVKGDWVGDCLLEIIIEVCTLFYDGVDVAVHYNSNKDYADKLVRRKTIFHLM